MREITELKQHLEYEIQCPKCNLSLFKDTFDLLNLTGFNCPHCHEGISITDKIKNKIVSDLPKNWLWKGQLYEKLYSIFDFTVYRLHPDKEDKTRIIVIDDNTDKIWLTEESQVTAEMLIIQHFIDDEPYIDWTDICIELIERYKK